MVKAIEVFKENKDQKLLIQFDDEKITGSISKSLMEKCQYNPTAVRETDTSTI